jgi:hypothetical protein
MRYLKLENDNLLAQKEDETQNTRKLEQINQQAEAERE